MKRLLLCALLLSLTMIAIGCQQADQPDNDDNAGDDNVSLGDGGDDQQPPDREQNDLLEAEGCKDCGPIAPLPWPEPDLADPTVISYDEDRFFTVDDVRFFPLGYYGVPQDADGLETFKNEGFNLALTGPGCCGSGTQPQIDFLHLAQEKGLFVILKPWSNRNDVLTRPEPELAAELAERNGVGNLFGWYTFDEPALHRPTKELTERMHYILSTYSADHPDALVEQALDRFSLYVDDCAVFMVDPYPVPYLYLSMVKATVLEAREATQDLKPVIGVQQSFNWEWYEGNFDVPFAPTAWDARNMAWQFIIFGARGLIPWKYSGDSTMHAVPEVWEGWLEEIAEMNELMRVILADEADTDLAPESTFPTMIDYVVKEEETASWVLSVSTNERPMYVAFDLSEIGTDLCVVDYTTGEIFEQDEQGKIRMKYAAYQVRLIEVMPQ